MFVYKLCAIKAKNCVLGGAVNFALNAQCMPWRQSSHDVKISNLEEEEGKKCIS